jgi:hypothetical protein
MTTTWSSAPIPFGWGGACAGSGTGLPERSVGSPSSSVLAISRSVQPTMPRCVESPVKRRRTDPIVHRSSCT